MKKNNDANKAYVGSWSANGSTVSYGWVYTNKRDGIKALREMCAGNVFAGGRGKVYVYDGDGRTVDEAVIKG